MKENIFAAIPDKLPEEIIQVLLENAGVSIERIISKGHHSVADFWYDQEKTEFVLLLQGAARLVFEDTKSPINMVVGDYIIIPAHRRHRVDWTPEDQETVWLAVHY